MFKRLCRTLAVSTLMIMIASPVAAIENGDPDRAHRNVGAFGFDLSPVGLGRVGLCSGFVISDRAFVTAAHCIGFAQQLGSIFGLNPDFVVSMEAGSENQPAINPGTLDFTDLSTIFQFKMLAETATATSFHIHHDYDPTVSTSENDVAVLEFPPGTFTVPPAQLADAGFLDFFESVGMLENVPVGLVGYGATAITGPAQFFIPGYRNQGRASLQSLSATRLTLTKSDNFSAGVLPADSGSPQTVLGKVVSLTSESDFQRLDTLEMQAFLMSFLQD